MVQIWYTLVIVLCHLKWSITWWEFDSFGLRWIQNTVYSGVNCPHYYFTQWSINYDFFSVGLVETGILLCEHQALFLLIISNDYFPNDPGVQYCDLSWGCHPLKVSSTQTLCTCLPFLVLCLRSQTAESPWTLRSVFSIQGVEWALVRCLLPVQWPGNSLKAINWGSQKQYLICIVSQITGLHDLMSHVLKTTVSNILYIFVALFQTGPQIQFLLFYLDPEWKSLKLTFLNCLKYICPIEESLII